MVQRVKVVIAMAIPGWSRIVEGENRLPEFSLTFTRVLGMHIPPHMQAHTRRTLEGNTECGYNQPSI